jgi:hypothetical protein
MRLSKFHPLACLFLLTFSNFAQSASVPFRMSHQGRLSDSKGTPATGTHTLQFAVYADPTGGTSLWAETQTVAFNNGYYSVLLGAFTPLPPSIFDGSVRYLGISIDGGKELSPRQALASAPYALNANNAVGDITPNSVTVNGVPVIDSTGKWVGPAGGPTASALSDSGTLDSGQTVTRTVALASTGAYLVTLSMTGAFRDVRKTYLVHSPANANVNVSFTLLASNILSGAGAADLGTEDGTAGWAGNNNSNFTLVITFSGAQANSTTWAWSAVRIF